MGLFSTLKWMWDPRTAEEKAYEQWDKTAPLRRKTQTMTVYIKDIADPIAVSFSLKDRITGFGTWRVTEYFEDYANDWLKERAKHGIRIDDVWYSPDQLVRIECGEIETSDIDK